MRLRVLCLAALVSALAGCGGRSTTTPFPQTVIGTLPQQQAIPKGDPTRGKELFAANGCGACHAYGPAGSTGTIGPSLDHLADDAKKADQGTLEEYVAASIQNPGAYVVPGYQNGVMPSFNQLTPQQVGDLVAFLTQSS